MFSSTSLSIRWCLNRKTCPNQKKRQQCRSLSIIFLSTSNEMWYKSSMLPNDFILVFTIAYNYFISMILYLDGLRIAVNKPAHSQHWRINVLSNKKTHLLSCFFVEYIPSFCCQYRKTSYTTPTMLQAMSHCISHTPKGILVPLGQH